VKRKRLETSSSHYSFLRLYLILENRITMSHPFFKISHPPSIKNKSTTQPHPCVSSKTSQQFKTSSKSSMILLSFNKKRFFLLKSPIILFSTLLLLPELPQSTLSLTLPLHPLQSQALHYLRRWIPTTGIISLLSRLLAHQLTV
jgi:hypothetical protein